MVRFLWMPVYSNSQVGASNRVWIWETRKAVPFEIRRITARDPAIAESFAATKEGRRGVTRFALFSVRF